MASIASLQRAAVVRAVRARRDLGFRTDETLDVFEAVRRAGLWLMFQPMDRLLGAYKREGDVAGMVLNVKVHPALQRFTAAHELGHHFFKHAEAVDSERNVARWTNLSMQERAAQYFASEFLMPRPAVNAVLNRLGVRDGDLDAGLLNSCELVLGISRGVCCGTHSLI
jgi:Zn-dependent peptidase ImmA (M78 family)